MRHKTGARAHRGTWTRKIAVWLAGLRAEDKTQGLTNTVLFTWPEFQMIIVSGRDKPTAVLHQDWGISKPRPTNVQDLRLPRTFKSRLSTHLTRRSSYDIIFGCFPVGRCKCCCLSEQRIWLVSTRTWRHISCHLLRRTSWVHDRSSWFFCGVFWRIRWLKQEITATFKHTHISTATVQNHAQVLFSKKLVKCKGVTQTMC